MEKHLNRVKLGLPLLFTVIIALIMQMPLYAVNDHFQLTGLPYLLFFIIKAIVTVFGIYLIGYSVEKQITKHKEAAIQ